MQPVDAVVMAGGRISGPYAEAAGTEIKGLVRVGGEPVARRVVEALFGAPGIGRVCVVGPEELTEALASGGQLWAPERGPALDNVRAGLERLGSECSERVLLCGSDVPLIDVASIQDFLERAPDQADICLPAVRREHFTTLFPGSANMYVPLREGWHTGGSQYLIRPLALEKNEPLLRELFARRKSQLGMARSLGLGVAWKLVTRRLTIAELEDRARSLTGCDCKAVMECRPELAYDIDSLDDLEYIEGWLKRRAGASVPVPRFPA